MFSRQDEQVLDLLNRLCPEDSPVDENALAYYKKKIRAATELDQLLCLMTKLVEKALCADVYTLTSLIKKFGQLGKPVFAQQVYLLTVKLQWFDHLITNNMILIAGANNDFTFAKEVYLHALETESYDKMTFAIMIDAASLNDEYVIAKRVFQHALELNLANADTYTAIIKAASYYRDLKMAKAAYKKAIDSGYINNQVHHAIKQAKELLIPAPISNGANHSLRLLQPPISAKLNPDALSFRPLNPQSKSFTPTN